MNKREEKIYEALQNKTIRELVLDRLWAQAFVIEKCLPKDAYWLKGGSRYIEPQAELGTIGDLRVAVGFKGYHNQDYDIRATFSSDSVWNFCSDLFKTKEQRYNETVAEYVCALNSIYAIAAEPKYANEKAALDKSKATVIEGLYKLSRIVNRHLDEWEE
jgi:hypothetical protein